MGRFRIISFYVAVSALGLGLLIALLDVWEIIDIDGLTWKIFASLSLLLVAALLAMLIDRLFGYPGTTPASPSPNEVTPEHR